MQSLEDIARLSDPHGVWTRERLNAKMEELRKEYEAAKDDIRLIIAHCIYNEEQYFAECLENDLVARDLDAIHILDGAWEHGGSSAHSTDRTYDIVMEFSKRHPDIQIHYETHPNNLIWESEPVKRNYQLKRIEYLYGDKPYYVLVKDGDEILKFNSGKVDQWFKNDLIMWYPMEQNVGLIRAYAYNSQKSGLGVRLIPSKHGIHYYTEESMKVHDKRCNLLMDYNPDREQGNASRLFVWDNVFFVNYWNKREENRLREKHTFDLFRDTQIQASGQCKWTQSSPK